MDKLNNEYIIALIFLSIMIVLYWRINLNPHKMNNGKTQKDKFVNKDATIHSAGLVENVTQEFYTQATKAEQRLNDELIDKQKAILTAFLQDMIRNQNKIVDALFKPEHNLYAQVYCNEKMGLALLYRNFSYHKWTFCVNKIEPKATILEFSSSYLTAALRAKFNEDKQKQQAQMLDDVLKNIRES